MINHLKGKVNASIASLPSIFGTVANAKGISEDAITHSDTTTNSSPQKVSPGVVQGRSQSPAQLSEPDHLSDDSESPDISIQKGCEQCETHRQRVAELEQTLEAKRIELKNTRELMRRIGVIAGSLLESCTDFDKQWVTHSRKVYSQIQSQKFIYDFNIFLYFADDDDDDKEEEEEEKGDWKKEGKF
uniref:Uncharacterized protein n=1 Tax=Elaeophora elaphi TaxID=1147741 RepID=A0A0R3S0W0_9BILA